MNKGINKEYFKGFGIVDTKSTWKPNSLIRAMAGMKHDLERIKRKLGKDIADVDEEK